MSRSQLFVACVSLILDTYFNRVLVCHPRNLFVKAWPCVLQEQGKLVQQLARLYGCNRASPRPARLVLAGLRPQGSLYAECLRKNDGFQNWVVSGAAFRVLSYDFPALTVCACFVCLCSLLYTSLGAHRDLDVSNHL